MLDTKQYVLGVPGTIQVRCGNFAETKDLAISIQDSNVAK